MADPCDVGALLENGEWAHALAAGIVRDPDAAADVRQGALVRALERGPDDASKLRAWLARVAKNVHLESLRTDERRARHEAAGARPEALPSTLELVERADTQRRLAEAVVALDEPVRTTILLRYFEGLAPREIARRQGVPRATVHDRITRGHRLLRRALAADFGPAGATGADLASLAALCALAAPSLGSRAILPGAAIMSTSKLAGGVAAAVALSSVAFFALRDGAAPSIEPAAASAARYTAAPAADHVIASGDEREATPERAALDAPPAEPAVPAAAPPPREPRVKAAVAGVVRDPDGAPVAGAEVRTGTLAAFNPILTKPGEYASARTDADGRFEFDALEPGTLDLTARGDGLAASETATLDVVAGEERDVGLVLRRGARLTGLVYRSDGELAVGRPVAFLESTQIASERTTTDDFGRFESPPLVPGTWTVQSVPSGEELTSRGISENDLLEHMAQMRVELADGDEVEIELGAPFEESVRVRGRVTLRGEPVQGLLQWFGEGPDAMATQKIGRTDASGAFELELEHGGPWLAAFTAGRGRAELVLDVPSVSEHELAVALPGGGIRGVVLGPAGEPLEDVSVVLVVEAGAERRSPMSLPADTKRTGADGSFAFDVLPPATYALQIEGVASLASSIVRGIELGRDEVVDDVDVVLAPGLAICGRVIGADGRPAQHGVVFVHDEQGRALNPISYARTGDDGSFTTPPLARGRRYTLLARVADQAGRPTEPVALDESLAGVELAVAPGAVLRVHAEGGAFLVDVFDERGLEHGELRDSRRPWDWLADGYSASTQRVGPLAPGTYRVVARGIHGGRSEKTVEVREAGVVDLEMGELE